MHTLTTIDDMLERVSGKLQGKFNTMEALAGEHDYWLVRSDNVSLLRWTKLASIIAIMKYHKSSQDVAKAKDSGITTTAAPN